MSIKVLGQEFEYPATWTGVAGLIGVCLTITLPACLWAMSNPNQARDVVQQVIGQIETDRLKTGASIADALDAHEKSINLLKAELNFLSDQIRKFDAVHDQSGLPSKTNGAFTSRPKSSNTNQPFSMEAWYLQTNQIRGFGELIRKRLDLERDSLDKLQKTRPFQ